MDFDVFENLRFRGPVWRAKWQLVSEWDATGFGAYRDLLGRVMYVPREYNPSAHPFETMFYAQYGTSHVVSCKLYRTDKDLTVCPTQLRYYIINSDITQSSTLVESFPESLHECVAALGENFLDFYHARL